MNIATNRILVGAGLAFSTMVNDFGDLPGEMRNDGMTAPSDGWRTVALVDNLQISVFIMVGATFAYSVLAILKSSLVILYETIFSADRLVGNDQLTTDPAGIPRWQRSFARAHFVEALSRRDADAMDEGLLNNLDAFALLHESITPSSDANPGRTSAVARDLSAVFSADALPAADLFVANWNSSLEERDAFEGILAAVMRTTFQLQLAEALRGSPATLTWLDVVSVPASDVSPLSEFEHLFNAEVWLALLRWHSAEATEGDKQALGEAMAGIHVILVPFQQRLDADMQYVMRQAHTSDSVHRMVLAWLAGATEDHVHHFRRSLDLHRNRHGRQFVLLPPRARKAVVVQMRKFEWISWAASGLCGCTILGCICAYSQFPSESVLETAINVTRVEPAHVSAAQWLPLFFFSITFGTGFCVTTWLVLQITMTDWQQNCSPVIQSMPFRSTRKNMIACVFICTQYMQYAVMTFKNTVPWWDHARPLLLLLKQVFDVDVPVPYSVTYAMFVSCFSITVALFWCSFDADSTRVLGSLVLPVVSLPCMRRLLQPLVSCTYYNNIDTAPCYDKDQVTNEVVIACFDPVSSLKCWDSGHLLVAIISGLSLLPLWWMGIAIITYFASHVHEEPTMPLSGDKIVSF